MFAQPVAILLLLTGTLVSCSDQAQPDCYSGFEILSTLHNETDSEISASNMEMIIESVGPAGTYMCAKCWSGNHDKDRCSCVPAGSMNKLQWSFTAGSTTKFWCQASWGRSRWDRTANIHTFPVFGDGVPKKSSQWKVFSLGKMRLTEDGNVKNDYPGLWSGTKP